MASSHITDHVDEVKSDMSAIYAQGDPRAYFDELGRLGYAIPDLAKPVFSSLIDRLKLARGGSVCALDLGCSYGVNGALLKHDKSMDELHAHWASPDLVAAEPETVIAVDREYFDDSDADADLSMIGLDASASAVAYAERAGLVDHGLALNLENDPMPAAAADLMANVDIVLSTGCVGYVTERSFEQLMPAVSAGQAPWMAHFVLRMFPFDRIAATVERWGYVTEKLENRTFLQRRFVSRAEQEKVVGEIEAIGLDPNGLEGEGSLHAEFYLSRPADLAGLAVAELLAA